MNKFTLLQPRREYEKFIKLFLRYALEKLGYLGVDDWLRWRELRNRLAHEYPDQPDLRFATLKTSIAAAHEMVAAYAAWKQRLEGVAPTKQH